MYSVQRKHSSSYLHGLKLNSQLSHEKLGLSFKERAQVEGFSLFNSRAATPSPTEAHDCLEICEEHERNFGRLKNPIATQFSTRLQAGRIHDGQRYSHSHFYLRCTLYCVSHHNIYNNIRKSGTVRIFITVHNN